jgi:hypothetical protein
LRQRHRFVPDNERQDMRRKLVPGKDAQEQRHGFVSGKIKETGTVESICHCI